MKPRLLCLALLPLAGSPFLALGTPSNTLGTDDAVDFSRDVRPILARNCFACHGADEESREADLRLDTFEGATLDLDGYQAIVPGKSAESELVLRIKDAEDPMPPEKAGHALSQEEIATLSRWIDEGAEYTPHWAFLAPVALAGSSVTQPAAGGAAWGRTPIDGFVATHLRAAGLEPAPEADRATLARRLSLDLVGLPPTLAEVRAFSADESPDYYERYVAKLLASPAYGERWAGVWLDLARYADSSGHGSDPLRVIWRYRDWVIDAYNSNMPFDQFTIEQLAGDLLPEATLEQKLATAFHRNTMTNTEGGTDDEEFRVAAVKDRAITTSQVWLGLTVGCAQCHNHKYDPLSQEEFYSFYAFFNQTADNDRGNDAPRLETPDAAQKVKLAGLRDQIADLEEQLADPDRDVSAVLVEWEAAEREWERKWQTVELTTLESEGGAGFELQPDGSTLVTGASPEKDIYNLTGLSPLAEISAVRIEILPHESLAQGGPGRLPGSGNVVLNDLAVHRETPQDDAPTAPSGRYVRVLNHGEGKILSLAEVLVFSGGSNVAPSGSAKQSSTGYAGPAKYAIDGNTDGRYDRKSVTHTNTEKDPWWELDLGSAHAIDNIQVWNRIDGDLEQRLKGFSVELLDAQRKVVWSRRVEEAPVPDMELALVTGSERLNLRAASASFSDAEWAVGLAIDASQDDAQGWGLNPDLAGVQTAVFETANQGQGKLLRFRLQQSYGAHHTIGRFRISVTDRPQPVQMLPPAVAEVLAIAVDERSAQQRDVLKKHYQAIDPVVQELRAQVTALQKKIKDLRVVTTPVMVALAADKQRTTHLMQRGNFLSLGKSVVAAVPAALHPWAAPSGAGGQAMTRLGLARWLMRPDNPLTARVTVNRYWARLFGRGIVTSEEDFGTQGAAPTHPELLDWLALEFIASGWDMKALLTTIVSSATYRQSSRVSPERLEKDPTNALYSRGPRFRMDAEMVRDVLLSCAGLLSDKMHGPSVYPPQPDGLWQAAFNGQRKWAESMGEDRYRRGLYVFLRRTSPYPSLETFDAPSGEICTVKRSRTNTPLQAFVTLNDPVYIEAAQALARRMVDGGGTSVRERIIYGLELCLQRPIAAGSDAGGRVTVLAQLYRSELDHYSGAEEAAVSIATIPLGPLQDGQSASELAAWTVVANVLLNQDAVLVKD